MSILSVADPDRTVYVVEFDSWTTTPDLPIEVVADVLTMPDLQAEIVRDTAMDRAGANRRIGV